MKRRSFLVGGAAAALTTWPAWLARAFDPDSACEPSERLQGLFDGYRAARRAGKPLLVLIVPERDEDMWERGALFGQVLNHGDDETLAMLSLVTLACATRQQLSLLVALDKGGDEPLFATVDTALRPAQVHGYRVDVPEVPSRFGWQGEWEDFEATTNRAVDAQIDALSTALRDAIGEITTASKEAATDFATERLAREILIGDEVASADVLRSARALHARAQASGTDRAKLIAALAAAWKAEVVTKPVRGSLWASGTGCGTAIEGRDDDQQYRVACGMGHVPAKSARFLYFFTRLPGEE